MTTDLEAMKHRWIIGPVYNGRWLIYALDYDRTSICHAFSKELAEHIVNTHNDLVLTEISVSKE